MYVEQMRLKDKAPQPIPFAAHTLSQLRQHLHQSRLEKQEQVRYGLAQTPVETFNVQEEERFCDFRLKTALDKNFAGVGYY